MSARLLLQTCLNHPSREAVGRCVECTRFFCRECIAEHDGRLICGECLARLTTVAPARPRRSFRGVRTSLMALAGAIFAWFCFYAIGSLLITLPSAWHEDTLWKSLGLPVR